MDTKNNWKNLWASRSAYEDILCSGDPQKVFMELKRANGFDVVKDGISYESFLSQYRQMREQLSRSLSEGESLRSVYEVGCGSGANLFLLEREGIACGGIDYSQSLLACAKQVLRAADIRCDEAYQLPAEPKYDAVISVSVFGYFTDEGYAEAVLEKMSQTAHFAVGILELADAEKKGAYTAYRKQIIRNYEERYKDLPRLFYSKAFFETFARRHGLDVEFCSVNMPDYWNSQFYFDCYLYKR